VGSNPTFCTITWDRSLMVKRMLCKHEIAGSSPVDSTKNKRYCYFQSNSFFLCLNCLKPHMRRWVSLTTKIALDYRSIHFTDHVTEGLTLIEIAAKYGVSAVTISRGFKNFDLQTLKGGRRDYSLLNRTAFDFWSPEMAYWLGFIAADGSVYAKSACVYIELKYSDREHLLKFQKFMGLSEDSVTDVQKLYRGNSIVQARVGFTDIYLKVKLGEYGVVPNKSHIDIDYLSYVPEDYILPFIIGFFDGDGGYVNQKSMSVGVGFGFTGSWSLLDHINTYLCRVFGFNYVSISPNNTGSVHNIVWSSLPDVKKFATLHSTILGGLPLSRKLLQSRQILDVSLSKRCSNCLSEITGYAKTGLCVNCSSLAKRKVQRPSKEELAYLIATYSFLAIGGKYGVSDNAVRKWARSYGLL
jgi:hypothetical protein